MRTVTGWPAVTTREYAGCSQRRDGDGGLEPMMTRQGRSASTDVAHAERGADEPGRVHQGVGGAAGATSRSG